MFRLILFISLVLFLQLFFVSHTHAQVAEGDTTGTGGLIPVSGLPGEDTTGVTTGTPPIDTTGIVETPPIEEPPPEEQPIIYGGKTTCTFKGGEGTPIDHVKTRESYIAFTGSIGQLGFELFEEEECEDVFSRVQISAYLSNLGIRSTDDIETGKKYKGITDYSFLTLRTIVEGDEDEVEIVSVSNYETETRRGLEAGVDVGAIEGEEPVAPSQAILRIDKLNGDTASGVIKIRFKGTVGLFTDRFVSGGDEEIRSLLRKSNTKAQLENEFFDNGIVDATCSFKNVPINVFDTETETPIDEDFDLRKFRGRKH